VESLSHKLISMLTLSDVQLRHHWQI